MTARQVQVRFASESGPQHLITACRMSMTAGLMGVAFETARAAVNRPADLTDEMIVNKIIELANAGERDVEVLGEAALNAPALPILFRLPLHRRASRILHLEPVGRAS